MLVNSSVDYISAFSMVTDSMNILVLTCGIGEGRMRSATSKRQVIKRVSPDWLTRYVSMVGRTGFEPVTN